MTQPLFSVGFNPRAREGRDAVRDHFPDRSVEVSIHAPARGATSDRRISRSRISVSIHAPARGATGHHDRQSEESRSFNPRAREGRDSDNDSHDSPLAGFQSTRPRGARLQEIFGLEDSLQGFNPRAREGRDTGKHLKKIHPEMFQSTRPRGARHFVKLLYADNKSFNPRAREGRDGWQA